MEEQVKTVKRRKRYNKVFMNVPTEYTVLFIVLFLITFGIIMVYSSSFNSVILEESTQPYVKQIIFALIGFAVMFVISRLQLDFINLFVVLGYIATVALLVMVFFFPEKNGARRWITIGSFNLQPSEVAKFTMIITLGYLLTMFKMHLSKLKVLAMIGFVVLVPVGLIGMEDMSVALVVGAICAAMILVAHRETVKIMFGGIIAGGMTVGFMLLNTYRRIRIKTYIEGPWIDPDGAGRQTIQSLYAIGSGGLTGIGLGQSLQKMGYISEAHNDIIFAIICEELGLIGGISILALYVLLLYRIFQISISAQSMNHFLVGIGVMMHIGVQAFINIGVATGLVPTTGMPLPFISYGGSSLIMFMAEIGLVLNIARHNRIEEMTGGSPSE